MADMTPQGTQAYSVESGYESADANIKAVVSGLSIILVSTLVVMAAMFGMFSYLNGRDNVEASRVPYAMAERVVPPEPRLLPSPYADEVSESKALGARSPDSLPWDKRNYEIANQYDEINATQTYKSENGDTETRIPISRAIELEAGVKDKGTPGVMTWEPEYPTKIAGETDKGMNLVPGQKNEEITTFDRRAFWETQDEKFTSDSTGGTRLQGGTLSR